MCSMLSMQADELREMAKAYENCGDCGQTSALLREAADTIISLRDRLQQAEVVKALLLKSEAQKIARIEELEQLVRDMWFWGYEGHMDSESQEWQMKHIDGVLDRMKTLGIEDE